MNDRPIYLDYQATTPVDPQVVAAMLPHLTTEFGNPSSSHTYGRAAAAAVAHAREQVAALPSGTESNHLALTGTAHTLRATGRGDHIITTDIEQPATSASCDRLAANGFRVTRIPVDIEGRVDPEVFATAIGPDTILASVMLANNEIGTLQPIRDISEITHRNGIVLHTDAAQTTATIGLDIDELGVDLLTLVGHKMYAPKGVAALYIRRGTPAPRPQLVGGQEHGLRAATENVPGIVALGAAAALAHTDHATDAERIRGLRDQLRHTLASAIPELAVNGSMVHRLPGNLSLTFPGITADELMAAAPGVAFSAGSACHTDNPTPSPVLTAIGLTSDQAARTIRLSIGRYTPATDIDSAAQQLLAAAASRTHCPAPGRIAISLVLPRFWRTVPAMCSSRRPVRRWCRGWPCRRRDGRGSGVRVRRRFAQAPRR
jgi:cysteine desulfurase